MSGSLLIELTAHLLYIAPGKNIERRRGEGEGDTLMRGGGVVRSKVSFCCKKYFDVFYIHCLHIVKGDICTMYINCCIGCIKTVI